MFYIYQHSCISPQQTFQDIDLNILNDAEEGKLKVVETRYEGIAPALLRRMGKAVRIGVGAGLPLVKENPDGIIIGTANGGMEDCIKFLDQIVEYNEGMLTPGNFVQSTNNAVAGQLGMMSRNTGYNTTHVHRAAAFENAIMDVDMLLKENPSNRYLLGAVDEISSANYNIEILDGSYKKEPVSNKALYDSATAGSIAGEGAVMFLAGISPQNAVARLDATQFFQAADINIVIDRLRHFLERHLQPGENIDVLLSGENGDIRLQPFYDAVENELPQHISVARFKHMSGEYPTAVAFACWLSAYILQQQSIPQHAIKKNASSETVKKILIYNNYKGLQHSFILMSR
ncbi:beta-ketoacyl synthase chain length factor [Taibaiella lutea]|uniref:Beta-ketoacyl synthase chain length factor n=1 Tax=Taibaiella lutea TaxID=2608001 RepID=A0A5M6CP81_9BACT|nr:beta-ketoacyl synthase chain length factor [Taibaiella lutea]KAA5536826.1 beta-ketoacyl synthase chain length factor [Taibaiella lutea]